MIKVTHIITGLGSGGAENMLYKLLKYTDREKYDHNVISLMNRGIYGDKIEELGVKAYCLNLNKKNIVRSIYKARKIAKDSNIINTWLYHADLFGFIVAKVLLRKKLIWNIRHSNLDKDVNKSSTLKIIKLNAMLSKHVDSITYNSNKALETHTEIGYSNKNPIVIPNGFELDQFKYNPDDRLRIRKDLMIKEEKLIITVGRWDVQKDYYTLAKALNELKKHHSNFKMIMVGTNLDDNNEELVNLIDKYSLNDVVMLLGRRSDIPGLLSASDIYVSSSLGESFSNAIGEAMACELACVVTDVGDSRLMVGETGKVVEAGDYINLAKELRDYIKQSSLTRNKDARCRVINRYGIKRISKEFEGNYYKTFLL